MDLEQHRETFWEQGYLVLEAFFDPGLMDHLDQVINELVSLFDKCVLRPVRREAR